MTFIKSSTRLGMGIVASSHGRAVGVAMAATITAATVTATAPALAISPIGRACDLAGCQCAHLLISLTHSDSHLTLTIDF